MAKKQFLTIIEELQELYGKEKHPVKHASFHGDVINFRSLGNIDTFFKKDDYNFRKEIFRDKKSPYETEYDKISSKQNERNEKPIGRTSAETAYDDLTKSKHDVSDKQSAQLELKASSTIQQAAYFPTKKYLVVSFKSGHTYSYENVDEDVIEEWQSASSAGSFFYYNIRMSFKYQKLG